MKQEPSNYPIIPFNFHSSQWRGRWGVKCTAIGVKIRLFWGVWYGYTAIKIWQHWEGPNLSLGQWHSVNDSFARSITYITYCTFNQSIHLYIAPLPVQYPCRLVAPSYFPSSWKWFPAIFYKNMKFWKTSALILCKITENLSQFRGGNFK